MADVGTHAKVELRPDGIITVRYSGHMDKELVEKAGAESDKYLVELQEKDQPILFLTDLGDVKSADLGAQQASRQLLATRHHDKVAILNLPGSLEIMARLILRITNHADTVRTFDSESEALAWLKS